MVNNMDSKVSIIVPIYNVEEYLPRCIDSIINQTYKNIEIILVDDGSPDNCGKICDDYAKKDDRIKVVHKPNGGLSDARNTGVKNSSGDYLFFVDSDDTIELDTIDYLLNGIIKYNADIACCGLSNIYLNGSVEKITVPKHPIVYNREQALDVHMIPGYIETITCNKLFKKSLFNEIIWPVGLLYEDMRTTYKIINKCNTIVLLPDSKYNYYKRDNSIGGSAFSNKTLDLLNANNEATKYVISSIHKPNIIYISDIHWNIVVLNKMVLSNSIDYELVKSIKSKIRKNFFRVILSDKIKIVRKIQMLLLFLSFQVYKVQYKKYIIKNR